MRYKDLLVGNKNRDERDERKRRRHRRHSDELYTVDPKELGNPLESKEQK